MILLKKRISDFKLLVPPSSRGISIFEKTERMKKSVQLTQRVVNSRKTKNLLLVKYLTKKDFFVRSTASLIAYWQAVNVYAKSILLTFQPGAGEKGFARLDELINFSTAVLQATYGQARRKQSDQLSDIWYSQSLQSVLVLW